MRAPRTTHAALVGMLIAAAAAGVLALGPASAAVVNSVIVEVSIAQAAHLPVPALLPAALDGLGGLALVALACLRREDVARAWLWALVLASLAASMGANGAHAVFPLNADGVPVLPWYVALGVAWVSPLSAAATAHLLLRIGARVAAVAGQLSTAQEPAPRRDASPPPVQPPAPCRAPDARDPRVIELARAGRGYRAVMEVTGWTRGRATTALAAAREHLRTAQPAGAAA